ncbi:MAG: RNA-binding S4 domain-containing protein [Muribaculaceae bacterium]|nr:RNA-binding S4 domain-containing protein [Muribaculaceae bacterium]
MDSNEKKSKRPRIGGVINVTPDAPEQRPAFSSDFDSSNSHANQDFNGQGQQRGYYRQNNGQQRQGGYYRQQQGGYNNRYNNEGYYAQRQQSASSLTTEGAADKTETSETTESTGYQPRYQQEGGYRPRQQGYAPRQGGYNNNRQGGYNNNRHGGYNNQGGYNNNNRQGGYNNQQGGYGNNRQGGYGNNRQGGYNNNNRQGGYNNNNRQGGYNNNRQGGYNNNRQGGYNNNRQGGYNNQQGGRHQMPRQNQFGMPRGGKSFTPRPKRVEYEMPIPDPNEQIRLNKFMANAGICSRREADEFIQKGLVKVNGNVVTELGTKISHNDTVEYDEKVVMLERKCYILLNKPKDCVTTSDDPNGRLTVMDIVKGACDERIYPVGRLDRNTTGVLLLTNDGDLASKLTHPKYVKKKIYHVWCDKDISEEDMQRIADGIELDDGPIHADAISYATETDRNQAGIEIHSGRNRIVRRIFESLGYHVTKLDRVYFAGLTKKNLPRGRWRYLTQEEVNFLKMGSFE